MTLLRTPSKVAHALFLQASSTISYVEFLVTLMDNLVLQCAGRFWAESVKIQGVFPRATAFEFVFTNSSVYSPDPLKQLQICLSS